MKKALKKPVGENPVGKKRTLTSKGDKLEEKKLEKYRKQTLLSADDDLEDEKDDPEVEDLSFEVDAFDDFDDDEDEDF